MRESSTLGSGIGFSVQAALASLQGGRFYDNFHYDFTYGEATPFTLPYPILGALAALAVFISPQPPSSLSTPTAHQQRHAPRSARPSTKLHTCSVANRLPSTSYWVIAVVPYLLWAFCTNHTAEECEKIYRVTSEVILVVQTYAFFNCNNYILTLLVVTLAGVVAYQLYVDTTSLPTRDRAMPSNVQASFGASVRFLWYSSETAASAKDVLLSVQMGYGRYNSMTPTSACNALALQFFAPVSACVCSRNVLDLFSTWTL
ncbi:hypothetical protein BC835DRAFT_1311509 [Cytidiella melzeri]|nr:hypothetical protein BC835DRAFT_1311509 [Cytidiella melzeri]